MDAYPEASYKVSWIPVFLISGGIPGQEETPHLGRSDQRPWAETWVFPQRGTPGPSEEARIQKLDGPSLAMSMDLLEAPGPSLRSAKMTFNTL